SICYYSLRSAAHRDLPSFPTRRSSDLHDALDLLRLLDQPAGELGKGLLASVERGGEARLCLLQKFGGFFEQPAVILEAAGDGRNLPQGALREIGEAPGIRVDEACRIGKALRRLCRLLGKSAGGAGRLPVDPAGSLRGN